MRTVDPPYELDPFALPQESRGRFWMFTVAALLFVWSLGGWWVEVPNPFALTSRMPSETSRWFGQLQARQDLAMITSESVSEFMETPFFRCVDEYLRLHLARIAVSVVLLLVASILAGVFYLRRLGADRRSARPLHDEAARQEVRRLSGLAGVKPPHLTWRPGLLDGFAFGPRRREVLVMAGHPKLLGVPWSAITRAVALHELAHIANGDIRVREISRSIGQALLAVLVCNAAAVATLSVVSRGELRFPLVRPTVLPSAIAHETPWALGIRTAMALGVLAWLWASLIRDRELYADARVASWGYLRPLMQRLRLRDRFEPRWWSLHRHPKHEQRLGALKSPRALFHLSVGLAFVTGLLVALAGVQLAPLGFDVFLLVAPIHGLLLMLLGPAAHLLLVPLVVVPTAAMTHLLTRTLGVQIQREAVAGLACGSHHHWGYFRQLIPAVCFAAGLEVGLELAPSHVFGVGDEALRWFVAVGVGIVVVWSWLVLLRAGSRLLLGSSESESQWRRDQRSLRWGSATLLGFLLWPLLLLRLASESSRHFEWALPLTPSGVSPATLLETILDIVALYGLVLGIVLYLLCAVILLGVAARRLSSAAPRCPSCRASIPRGLLIGRLCRTCRAPLAPWFLQSRYREGSV